MLLECLQFWWYFQRHYCLLFLSNTYALNYDVLNLASLLGVIPDSEILVDLRKFKSSYHGWWQRSSASRVISHVSTGLIHGYSLLLIPKFSFLGFSESVYPYSYSPYSSFFFIKVIVAISLIVVSTVPLSFYCGVGVTCNQVSWGEGVLLSPAFVIRSLSLL